MTKEADPQPPAAGFNFTEHESLFYRVSDVRFQEFFDDEQTAIHRIELTSNSYGEFLFIKLSRPTEQSRQAITFYSLGYHEFRERWIDEVWFWYKANPHPSGIDQTVAREDAQAILKQRQAEIAAYADKGSQSSRAQLFEVLADMADDDAALAEMQDLNVLWDEPQKDEAKMDQKISKPEPIAVNWVSREDLLYCRDDLREQIEALDASDIALIADKLGDALQDTYWLALNIVLADYLSVDE